MVSGRVGHVANASCTGRVLGCTLRPGLRNRVRILLALQGSQGARRVHNAGAASVHIAGERLRGLLQNLLCALSVQRGIHGLHQGNHASNLGCRHGSAVVLGVACAGGHGGTQIHGGHDAATGSAHINNLAVVGEVATLTVLVGSAHHDRTAAVSRSDLGGVLTLVTGSDNENRAALVHLSNSLGVGCGAGALSAEGEVNNLGGVGVRGNALNGAAGCPDHCIRNVGVVAAAHAQGTHGQDLGGGCHADNTALIVHDSRDGACNVGAVPVRLACLGVGIAGARFFPVALVGRVGVAAVAVAGHGGLGDEVVAGQNVSVQVGVLDDAGVNHSNGHASALGGLPGLGCGQALGAVQVPLLRVEGVVRRYNLVRCLGSLSYLSDLGGRGGTSARVGAAQQVGLNRLDGGVRAQGCHVLLRLLSGELGGDGHHGCLLGGGAYVVGLDFEEVVNALHLGGEALVEGVAPGGNLGACGACPVDAAGVQRAVGVGDDEAVEACLLLFGAEGGDGGVRLSTFGAVGLRGCREGCGGAQGCDECCCGTQAQCGACDTAR